LAEELDVDNPDNADQYTNFDRDGALIDGSQEQSDPFRDQPNEFGDD
jgi:hypothetical protein